MASRYPHTEEQVKEYIKKMGEKANRRLRDLEKAGLTKSTPAYQYVKRASKDGMPWTDTNKKGEVKFKTAIAGLPYNELQKIASRIYRFLEAKTTVTESRKKFDDAYNTYMEKHPNIDVSQDEFNEFFSAGLMGKFKEMFGSKEMVVLHERTANSMTTTEIEDVLESVGFGDETKIGEIYKAIDEYELNKYAKNFEFNPFDGDDLF